jgi:hypothetical protein
VGTQTHSRNTASQADGGGQPSRPYPLTRGEVGFWLRRGEQLGRAARWIAATVTAGHTRAAHWRRQVASKLPGHSPTQPG